MASGGRKRWRILDKQSMGYRMCLEPKWKEKMAPSVKWKQIAAGCRKRIRGPLAG
jgi:hypothetical protein